MAVEFRTQLQIFQSIRAFLSEQTEGAITDFNVGSVLNSILFTFSNSIGSLYATAQNVFNAAFVSTATGDDLDKKVEDFTLSRNLATNATGIATFFRTSASNIDYIIPNNTTLLTQTIGELIPIEFKTTEVGTIFAQIIDEEQTFVTGTTLYDLDRRLVSSIVTITGTLNGSASQTFTQDVDYQLNQSDSSQHAVEWLGVDSPDNGTIFYVTYRPLSVDVAIQAREAGTTGNVAANTITVAPNPPGGIDGVNNYSATSGGTDTETDEDLRERVPLFLSTLARGTKDALRGRALDVTGVVSASVAEPDFPNGLVDLIIDDGSGTATDDLIRDVRDAIDGTQDGIDSDTVEAYRAAGIWVNVTAPTIRSINVEVEAYALTGTTASTISSNINSAITNYLSSLGAGENVVRAQIIEEVMAVTSVEDINLSTLEIDGSLTGNISIGSSEVARAGVLSITISTYSE